MTIVLFIIPGIFLLWDVLSLIAIRIESRKKEDEAAEKMKQPHLKNPKFTATYKSKKKTSTMSKTSIINQLNIE